MNWFRSQTQNGVAHVSIFGEIGIGGTARDFIEAVADAPEVRLRVDSRGGCARTAMEIFEFLSTRETTIEVTGKCYSSALFLAMAAKTIAVHPSARFLVHAPVNWILGSAETLALEAKALRKLTESIASAISSRTRQPIQAVAGWLAPDVDTYFTAHEALAVGLCDAILPERPARNRKTPATLPDAPAGPPPWSDEERLLLDFLQAVGPLSVASRERLGRELGVWFSGVRESQS